MARDKVLEQKRIRGGSGKQLGRPDLCGRIPGSEECLRYIRGPRPAICRNCHSPEIQTEKMKVFAP